MDIPLTPTYTFTTGGTYTVPIVISGQSLPLQLDLGSSDLVIASSSCNSASCSGSVMLYDENAPGQAANSTGVRYNSNFLSGNFSGPILTATVAIGNLAIPSQAFAAADQVSGEPLSGSRFSGVLGLNLPGNSIISSALSSATSPSGLGNPFISNLLTSSSIIPTQQERYFTLTLGRQNDPRYSSLLTISKPNTNLPAGIAVNSVPLSTVYAPPGQAQSYWRTPISRISVNGVVVPFTASSTSAFNSTAPIALFDTGISAILTSRDFANSFWGAAANIGPASDGNYYVPCNTTFNVSMTFASQQGTEYPLHPLDLTQSGMQSGSCIGQLQAYDLGPNPPADFILGTSAMRNFYSVFSLTNYNASRSAQFGLLPLTDQASAHSEFARVRINGRSLNSSDDTSSSTMPADNGGQTEFPGERDNDNPPLSVGADIGIAFGAFAVLLFVVVAGYMCYRTRKRRMQGATAHDAENGRPSSPLDNPTLIEQEQIQDKQAMADLVAKDDAEQSRWRMFHEPGPEAAARAPAVPPVASP